MHAFDSSHCLQGSSLQGMCYTDILSVPGFYVSTYDNNGLPVFILARMLLGSKIGRIFAAIYLVAIHAFVFGLIYYAALSSQPVINVAAGSVER